LTIIYYIDYSIFDDCDAVNKLNAHRSNSYAVDRSNITHAESISSVIDRSAVESMKMNNEVLVVNLEVVVEEIIAAATLNFFN